MKTTLALLCGGLSTEDYLSRRSCQFLYPQFTADRYDLFILDWQRDGTVVESQVNEPGKIKTVHPDIISCFAEFIGDIVVNLTHGGVENSGQLQGLLDLARIPYTGNGVTASAIGMNKILTKFFFRELRIPCSADFLFCPDQEQDFTHALEKLQESGLNYPLILKPLKGGSSEGICLIRNKTELQKFLDTEYDDTPYVFEEFLQGEDYCVGVFSTRSEKEPFVLPVARIRYDGHFFDAQIKQAGTYTVEFPENIDKTLIDSMCKHALQAHKTIGLQGFSRTDFILRNSEFFAIEINTHPGMSEYSILPKMLQKVNLSIQTFYEKMVEIELHNRLV